MQSAVKQIRTISIEINVTLQRNKNRSWLFRKAVSHYVSPLDLIILRLQ